MREVNWSKWYSFKELEKSRFRPVPTNKGVYQIRCAINGKPIVIPRSGEVDKYGILYIGKTESRKGIKYRVRLFWKGVHEKGKTLEELSVRHTGANTYVIYNFSRKFPVNYLEVRWAIVDNPSEVERELLWEYAKKYLDKPPLNLSIRRR